MSDSNAKHLSKRNLRKLARNRASPCQQQGLLPRNQDHGTYMDQLQDLRVNTLFLEQSSQLNNPASETMEGHSSGEGRRRSNISMFTDGLNNYEEHIEGRGRSRTISLTFGSRRDQSPLSPPPRHRNLSPAATQDVSSFGDCNPMSTEVISCESSDIEMISTGFLDARIIARDENGVSNIFDPNDSSMLQSASSTQHTALKSPMVDPYSRSTMDNLERQNSDTEPESDIMSLRPQKSGNSQNRSNTEVIKRKGLKRTHSFGPRVASDRVLKTQKIDTSGSKVACKKQSNMWNRRSAELEGRVDKSFDLKFPRM